MIQTHKEVDMKEFDTSHKDVQMALIIKLYQCHRQNLTITYDELEKIFYRLIWRHKKPSSLHEAVSDIFGLSNDQMVGYLSKVTELESYQKTIDDYKDVLLNNED